jgi:hypothetical protein
VNFVRLLSFGQPDPALAEALVAAGFELEARVLPAPTEEHATAALASALREAEAALQDTPAAVLVVGTDDAALGAALTAVKAGVPTAWAGDRGRESPLVAHVAELTIDATADAAEGARAVTELVARKMPSA